MHDVIPIARARKLPVHKRSPSVELGYLIGEIWRAQLEFAVATMRANARVGSALLSLGRL